MTPAGHSVPSFGERLRARRIELRLSQRQLAEKVGIAHTHISRLERQSTNASLAVLRRLAQALGVSPQWFLGEQQSSNFEHIADEQRYSGLVQSLADQISVELKHRRAPLVAGGGYWQPIGVPVKQDRKGLSLTEEVHSVLMKNGDSMVDAGINEGDLLASSGRPAQPGDIVVANINDSEVIMRYYYPRPDGTIELRPGRKGLRSIVVSEDAVSIEAVVTHVWR